MVSSGKATKRGRNGPCEVCGHFHKYEEGEVCGICGHRLDLVSDRSSIPIADSFTEILPEFLFLGDYTNAAKHDHLKAQGISRILNTVPSSKNLYVHDFTYFSPKGDDKYPFNEAIEYLDNCERERARVLVHCMSGTSRSPAIVIAYLMKCKQWSLAQSYQWVKERRPAVKLQQDAYEHLLGYQQMILNNISPPTTAPAFSFVNPEGVPAPTFSPGTRNSIFDSSPKSVPSNGFMFGSGQAIETSFMANEAIPNAAGRPMDCIQYMY